MIRSLRAKLVGVSMLAMFLVLFIMIGALNIINYRNILSEADGTLNLLEANGGVFPDTDWTGGEMYFLWEEAGTLPALPQGETPLHSEEETPPPFPSDGGRREEMGLYGKGRNGMRRNMTPMSIETRFETRYFTVEMNGEACVSVNLDFIAAVDAREAETMARSLDAGKTSGFLGNYRYLIGNKGENSLILFLDCTKTLANYKNFLYVSIAASLGGLGIVFVLILIFSGRIMRPVHESYEKQKQFITDAGHELKTPLAIISADADVLESDIGENEWLQDIHVQVDRLGQLTHDLVFLSRMEESKTPAVSERLNLSALTEETASSFQGPALTQHKTLQVRTEENLMIRGDPNALKQLVNILMDNAVKYCLPEGKITCTLQKQGKFAALEVENSAEPLSKEELPRLFDRFYRGDRSRSSEKSGYGIGLSIAKAVTDAHGGKITASSPQGDTLKITVLLPLENG